MKRFPSEILCMIFLLACTTELDSTLLNSAPWNFSQTCRFWRAITHSNPDLWCKVAVRKDPEWPWKPLNINAWLEKLRSGLTKRLELTKDRPLDILIRTQSGEPVDLCVEELVMSLLLPHRARWRSLDFVVSRARGAEKKWMRGRVGLPSSERVLPRLERLEIAFTEEVSESHRILSLFNDTPALKQITIYRPPKPGRHPRTNAPVAAGDNFQWPALKTLCLVKHDPDVFPNILSRVNNITLLRLDCLKTLRGSRDFAPRTQPRMYVFHQLVGLSIGRGVGGALGELTAGRALRSLDFGGRVSGRSLRHFLHRSKARNIESMDCEEVTCDRFHEAVLKMPKLAHLCIRAISVDSLKGVAKTLAPAWTRTGQPLEPKHSPFPLLRSLILHGFETSKDSRCSYDPSFSDEGGCSTDEDRDRREVKYYDTLRSLLRLLTVPYGMDFKTDIESFQPWPQEDRITCARITVQDERAWKQVPDRHVIMGALRGNVAKGLNVDVGFRDDDVRSRFLNGGSPIQRFTSCLWAGRSLKGVPAWVKSEVAFALDKDAIL